MRKRYNNDSLHLKNTSISFAAAPGAATANPSDSTRIKECKVSSVIKEDDDY